MTLRPQRLGVPGTTIICLLLCGTAAAQTPEQIFAEAGAAMAKTEYARVVELLKGVPETADPKHVVKKHTGSAIALCNLSRFAEVPPHLARARDVAQKLGDPAVLAPVESADGVYFRMTRRVDLAIAAYERAAQLAVKAGDRSMQGRIYGQLAGTYRGIEDWERAMYYGGKGFELIEKPTPTERFNYFLDRGIAYFELYDRDGAEAMFKEGLALAVQAGAKRDESYARGELGFTYWTFDRDASGAINYYSRAIELAIEAQSPTLHRTWLLNRGGVWRDTGEHERALQDFRASIAMEPAGFAEPFAATKNIGQTYRLMGRLEEARTTLETLLKERPGSPSPRHVWQAHMELASTYEALGDRTRAEAEYRRMLDTLEEHRNTSILDAFRSGSFAHSLRLYDPYDRYIRFLTSGNEASLPGHASALHVAERARARGFLEMLAGVRSSLASAIPPALVEEQTRIMRGISGVQRKLRAPDVAAADRAKLLSELGDLERQRDEFRVKLRVEHPALAEARYPDVADAKALQPSLRAGETAVVYYLSEPESFRWVVTRERVTLRRIASRKAIEGQAEKLRSLLRAPGEVAPVRAEAAALSTLLLDGVDVEAGRSLLVVPHGVLHYVPFEVLPLHGSLLIERHPVSYAPSLNSIARLRGATNSPAAFRVLAVGNPSVPARDAVPASARSGDIDTISLLGPLPFAGEEIGAIERAFGRSAETLTGPDARESAFRAADLGSFPIIHFATHGLVNEARPGRSGLLFSPESGEDGLLQMAEIYKLGLNADLVVLSACQTALGREITGEGIVGLTRAFFYAGSRSVLAALWNLNDRFAANFVQRFYDEVRAGRPTEEALRQTKIAYLTHPQYQHPFYWSSLVLTGDGTRVLYRDQPRLTRKLGGFFVSLLVIAIIVYRRRSQRRGRS